MLLALLLQTSWPTLHPLLMLFIGATVSAVLTFLAALYWRRHDADKAARAAELAAAALAATEKQEWENWLEWREHIEEQVASFMPKGSIKEELEKLGREIGDNQGKIKAYHDAAESNYNAINQRTSTLEQHNINLIQLPEQVGNLKTDYRVLAAKVDTLASNIERLSDKQDRHFGELMQAVSNLSYTRGQLSGRPPAQGA